MKKNVNETFWAVNETYLAEFVLIVTCETYSEASCCVHSFKDAYGN